MARVPFLDKFRTDGPLNKDERGSLAHICRNLQALLNTKEGYGSFLRGFGLGEYSEKSGTRDLLVALLEEMKSEIRRYEPRLAEVDLRLRGRDAGLRMYFDLTAVLAADPDRPRVALRICFDTLVTQVTVEEAP